MTCLMYSIGHSTVPLEQFVELATGAGVDVIADIRRFPRSRRNPQFGRERLEQVIAYVWLGAELGGFREGGYEDWTRSEEFARGLATLERVGAERTVAFMCAEAVPWKCHRLYVARALVSRGHRIGHLLPGGRIELEQTPLVQPDQ